MKKKMAVIITALVMIPIFLAGAYFYYWIFTNGPFPRFISIAIILGSALVISAFIGVVIQRIREIDKEKEHDLSKY